jgi:hypothetical protein
VVVNSPGDGAVPRPPEATPAQGAWQRELRSEEDTLALGRAAAAALPVLERAFVLRLQGDLGAGKTTFARGLLAGLGHAGPVRSPSYGLVAEYETGGRGVLHLDLYRLQDRTNSASSACATGTCRGPSGWWSGRKRVGRCSPGAM